MDDQLGLGVMGGGDMRGFEDLGSQLSMGLHGSNTFRRAVSLINLDFQSATFLRCGGGRNVCELFLPLACPIEAHCPFQSVCLGLPSMGEDGFQGCRSIQVIISWCLQSL